MADPRRPSPVPAAGLMDPLVRYLGAEIEAQKQVDPFRRSARFVSMLVPALRVINAYFGAEVRGFEHLPKRGPFLVVGNHSGGAVPADLYFFLLRWIEERGPKAPLYALAYDLNFVNPALGRMLRWAGCLPANPQNARKALARGAAVIVFPGGDYEVFRPWTERNRIAFGGRTGFVKLALSAGVPVVPMTIHGAHQSTFVLTRGRRIARVMGIDRLNVNVFPLIWNIPLGLTSAAVPSVQLPAKVTVQIGRPLQWARYGKAAARNQAVVQRCYDEITGIMQRTLDELDAEHPYPIFERLQELSPMRVLAQVPAWLAGGTPPPPRERPRAAPHRHATRIPRRAARRRRGK